MPEPRDHTPRRTVRVPDERWEAAKRVAADRDESLTEAINRMLERYIRDHPASSD